nr:hypothetical protein [Tanacetum cinerariifolium]
MRKSKRVKRPGKKSTEAPTRGVVIRETPEMTLTKKKEKVDVTQEESYKSKAESWGNDKDDSNNEQVSSGEDNDQENDKSNHEENEEYEEEVNEEFVKTPSNDCDDKAKGDENEEMNYTISQLCVDVDIWLNEPVDTDKGVTTLEKEVDELKKDDPLKTQVTSLVDKHLDMVKELLKDAVLEKESSQPQSSYEATATLTKFELKKILIDKMDKSESYLAAPEHKECYEGLIKSYELDTTILSTYDSNMPQDQEENPGCDNIKMDRAVKNVMSDLSGLKKLVKDLSDRFDEYEGSKSEDSFPFPLGLQVKEPHAKPSARPIPTSYPDDPYVVTRDAAIVAATVAAVATSGIDDDDDTAPMDSQPYEPCGSPLLKPSFGMRERVQNEANHAGGPNVASVARECTFSDFMKYSPITFRGNEGAVMMTEEFCPPKEIQRVECELWNLRVKETDISSYTARFNELMILCPGMVPTEQKKVEAYIRGLSKNIKGEVILSEPTTLNKAVQMRKYLTSPSPSVIQKMVKELLEDAVLAKESSQPQSSYEATATLTKFKLKKILIDKMDKSESYLAAPEHRECYEGLIKSYELDTTILSTYGKVYLLKRSRKDKDEDPSARSDRGLK